MMQKLTSVEEIIPKRFFTQQLGMERIKLLVKIGANPWLEDRNGFTSLCLVENIKDHQIRENIVSRLLEAMNKE